MNEETHSRDTILAGIIFSLCIGFFDLILIAVFRSSSASDVDLMLAPVAAVAFGALLSYLIFWLVCRYWISAAWKLPLLPVCFAMISFAGMMFALTGIWVHMNPEARFSIKFFLVAICFLISFVIAALLYSSVNRLSESRKIVSFCFTLPFLLAENWIAWIFLSRTGGILSPQGAIVVAIYVALSVATIWLMMGLSNEMRTRLVNLLFIFVVVIPLIGMIVRHWSTESVAFEPGKNKILPVILITIDTLRADQLSAYGTTENSTPNMDRLSSDGLTFLNAYSPSPWTVPSLISIMTGHSPLVHHVLGEEGLLPEKIPTLAERMSAAGYYSASIVGNPYISHSGLSRGFRDFYSFEKETNTTVSLMIRSFFESGGDKNYSYTEDLTSSTLNWLEKNSSKNFFLWLHYLDPHLPYSPPREYVTEKISGRIHNPFDLLGPIRTGKFAPTENEKKAIRSLYESEVRYIDRNVGLILDTLRKLGLYDSALIVLTSDHGEEFWEHHGFEHGHTLYNELVHVPLIMKLPNSSRKGTVSERLSIASIAPTIIELSQAKQEGQAFTARSLLQKEQSETPVVMAGTLYFDPKVALIFGGYKYIKNLNTGFEELYDLTRDPAEQDSQASNLLAEISTARKILSEQYKFSEDFRRKSKLANTSEPLDQDTADQLRSLGYIQ